MTTPRTAAALTLAALLGACASQQAADQPPRPAVAPAPAATGPTKADEARLDTLVKWMTGSFDSAEQGKADPAYFDIRLHMTPIWTSRPAAEGRWLYVEQSMAEQLGKPYRQRIYRVTALGGGRFRSAVFELPGDPLVFAGAWRNTDAFIALTPDKLVSREGCAITLTDTKDGFIGSTNAQDCASTLRGATYTTSRVTVTEGTLISWDQGFDAEGKQVWGATKGGYIFRKRGR